MPVWGTTILEAEIRADQSQHRHVVADSELVSPPLPDQTVEDTFATLNCLRMSLEHGHATMHLRFSLLSASGQLPKLSIGLEVLDQLWVHPVEGLDESVRHQFLAISEGARLGGAIRRRRSGWFPSHPPVVSRAWR
jgi:hypothetical protein